MTDAMELAGRHGPCAWGGGADGLDPMDLQLLVKLRDDNRHDGSRPVIEKDQAAWTQAFRLSDAGLIAIEQLAMGGCLHITRKGVAAVRSALSPTPADATPGGAWPANARFKFGELVQKIRGSKWRGRVNGFYVTDGTPIGYAVESSFEKGSTQVWPEAALEPWDGVAC